MNESRVWLRIIGKSCLLLLEQTRAIYRAGDELCGSINASIKTIENRTQNT